MNEEKTVRQKEIIDSARRIIITKGMEHLTVREIAKDLKITDGALYRHFKSKTEIISLLIDDIETTLLSAIEKSASSPKEPLQKLEDIFLSHLSYAEQRKGVSFIVINKTLSVKDKILQKKMFEVLTKYLKMIKQILKEGIKTGGIRRSINLDCASIAFLGMIQSLVTLWSLSGNRNPLGKNRLDEMFGLYKESIAGG